MRFKLSMLIAVLAALPTLSQAQIAATSTSVVMNDKGVVRSADSVVMQGRILAIDQENRRVTVKGGSGNELSFVVGPEVKNFSQLKVGDIVTLNFIQSLALELKKGGQELRQRVESGETISAQPGEKPMDGESTTVSVIADVTAVNRKTGVVTLRGPQRSFDLKVKDKTMLKNVVVGDQVEATFVEATVISVRAAKPAKRVK